MKYREIFVFVVGVTPQIITETLYAFNRRRPRVRPEGIHILTTLTGKTILEKELLERGLLGRFYEEFDIPPVHPKLHCLANKKGRPLSDIRTARENEAAGDFIVDFIREKTRDPGTRLRCSLAGGRKTMSFYLGSALSLFGRPRDRLYHVLLAPEFESHPDFYWRPKKDRMLEIRDRHARLVKKISTREAGISLAELPYIRIRDRFPLDVGGLRDLISTGQREINAASPQPEMWIDIKERTLRARGASVNLPPFQLAVYLSFIREKLSRCRRPERPLCGDCADCFLFLSELSGKKALKSVAREYEKFYPGNRHRVRKFLRQWREGIEIESLRQAVSKINRALREGLGDTHLSRRCEVSSVGRHGDRRHGVRADKGRIRIEEGENS